MRGSSPSRGDRRRGALLLLAVVAGWLAWISGVGWAAHRNCVEGFQMLGLPTTPERLAGCDGPVWRAPLRGLEWGWPPDDTLLMWLLGTGLALAAAGWVVHRATRRRAAPVSSGG